MTVFLTFFAANAQYIYAACALVALYLLRVAIKARRERRASIFPLEREIAHSRLYRTFALALLLAAIMFGTWAVINRLLPRLQQTTLTSPPTPNVLVLIDTPTPTQAPPTPTFTPAPTATPRPTRRPPTPTPAPVTPAPPSIRPPLCANPGAAITSPGIGQTLTGDTAVTGAANIDNFQFFKLEWSAGGDHWNWFAGSETPASGVLGAFRASELAPGVYTIRLVVVDKTGNYPDPCTVQVTIP